MKKRDKKIIASFEIFLLVVMSFSLAFILSDEVGLGSAQDISPGLEASLNAQRAAAISNANQPTANIIGSQAGAFTPGNFEAGQFVPDKAGSLFMNPGVDDRVFDSGGNVLGFMKDGKMVDANTYNGVSAPGAGGTGGGGLLQGVQNTVGSIYKGQFGGQFGAPYLGPLVGAAAWGFTVYGIVLLGAKLFGLGDKQAQSVALSAGVAAATWSGIQFAAASGWFGATGTGTLASTLSTLAPFIGIGIGIGILLATYKTEKREVVKFQCLPWEPPLGGQNCEKCNNDKMPCSEYRCKSLGQGCGVVNKGTDKEMCTWISKFDVNAPTIKPWNDALAPKELKLSYIPDKEITPPNTGYKIVMPKGKGCLPAFTRLRFGILTNEPAQCKISLTPGTDYDSMGSDLFGETNLFLYNHTQQLKVPAPFEQDSGTTSGSSTTGAGGLNIKNGGTYSMYVRCVDANGNGKDSVFTAFKFCVDDGPDTTAPVIESFSQPSGTPVPFDVDKVHIETYVNEPSDCKWSKQDKSYDAMENTMTCGTQAYQVNADLNYVCAADLTGVKNKENNDFYFRCKDQPTKADKDRNVMTTSEHLVLRGTEALTITSVGPTGTISGGTTINQVSLLVQTSHGADDGKAICYIDTQKDGEFSVAMESDFVVKHNLTLDFEAGNYTYFFDCKDAGNNEAKANVTFTVKVDNLAPLISRVYRDGDSLKIITDKQSKCAYSLNDCTYNFDEATNTIFSYDDPVKKTVQSVPWDPDKTYYIKCESLYNVGPKNPNQCSLVVRGSDL